MRITRITYAGVVSAFIASAMAQTGNAQQATLPAPSAGYAAGPQAGRALPEGWPGYHAAMSYKRKSDGTWRTITLKPDGARVETVPAMEGAADARFEGRWESCKGGVRIVRDKRIVHKSDGTPRELDLSNNWTPCIPIRVFTSQQAAQR